MESSSVSCFLIDSGYNNSKDGAIVSSSLSSSSLWSLDSDVVEVVTAVSAAAAAAATSPRRIVVSLGTATAPILVVVIAAGDVDKATESLVILELLRSCNVDRAADSTDDDGRRLHVMDRIDDDDNRVGLSLTTTVDVALSPSPSSKIGSNNPAVEADIATSWIVVTDVRLANKADDRRCIRGRGGIGGGTTADNDADVLAVSDCLGVDGIVAVAVAVVPEKEEVELLLLPTTARDDVT